MSVQSEITRLENAKNSISTAITNKGVAVPSGTKLDGMAALIGNIESGGANLQTKSVTYTANGTATITPDEGYDGLSSVDVTVNVSGGGGGGAGFSVTFPATAKNWDYVDTSASHILLADGTTKLVINYSTIGGKTIENVAGILIKSISPMYVLRMTLSAGGIAQFNINQDIPSYVVTTAPNATVTQYFAGMETFWWPVADTVISAIEMYNTD